MKPNMHINVLTKTVLVEDSVLNLRDLTETEFADTIIERWEYLWGADEVNATRRDLIQLHQAIWEA